MLYLQDEADTDGDSSDGGTSEGSQNTPQETVSTGRRRTVTEEPAVSEKNQVGPTNV